MRRLCGMLHCRAMPRSVLLASLVLLGLATACDTSDRIGRLEKQNQELQAEIKKGQATADYDLQAKCSKDARVWFNENWKRDKDTLLLDFTNHYNKELNKCFLVVEYHYRLGLEGTWVNDVELYDVYENSKVGTFGEDHIVSKKPAFETRDVMVDCELFDVRKCKTLEEFNGLVRPYMND